MVYEYQAMIDKLKNSVTGDSCIACNISSMEIELLRGKCDIMVFSNCFLNILDSTHNVHSSVEIYLSRNPNRAFKFRWPPLTIPRPYQ